MAQEIERKFRVRKGDDTWHAESRRSRRIVQGYVVAETARSVRVRIEDADGDAPRDGEVEASEATLTLKGASHGAVRSEWEYPIPVEDARSLLAELCGARVVEKTRHEVSFGGALFEVDEFHGANQGLVVAEVELDDEGAEVPPAPWLGEEVTGDPRYLNARLATRPFTRWSAWEPPPEPLGPQPRRTGRGA